MAQGIVEQPSQGSEQQQSGAAKAGPSRSQLVQRLLDQTASLPAFIEALLTAQAVTVAGTEAAGFLIERAPTQENPQAIGLRALAHIRPDNSDQETRTAALQAFHDLVKPCVEKGKDGAIEVGGANDRHELQFCLITLLRSEGQVVAASACVTRCIDTERARQRLMSMQLIAGYFELFTLRRDSEQSKLIAASHQEVLQLATSVATAEGFESAANNLCNELATRSHAARVSLGWMKGRHVRVKALSHTEQFDKKQELIVQLEKAMEECLDQEEVVQFDPAGKSSSENVTRAHAALSRAQNGGLVLSLPLRRKADIVGVITLEFLPGQELGPNSAQALSVAVDLLAPPLYDRYQNDRWLITKAALSTRDLFGAIVGPKHMLAKLVVILVAALVAVAVLYKPIYKVGAPFTFVGQQDRVVCAPFDGHLEELGTVDGAPIKPGTAVKAGQLLVKMDTKDLEEDLIKFRTQARIKALEANGFRNNKARRDVAKAMVAEAERDEAMQEVKLLELKIARANVRAPIDGVILTGDLEEMLGAPVERGKPLFQIGPVEELKVELAVNERDIQDVELGQSGTIATTSLPTEKFPVEVERIVPLGEAKEGKNLFKVYARLTGEHSPEWRPGMVGEARIEIRPEPVWWIYSHRVIDWVRLKLWI